jgi:hypothetical protein
MERDGRAALFPYFWEGCVEPTHESRIFQLRPFHVKSRDTANMSVCCSKSEI